MYTGGDSSSSEIGDSTPPVQTTFDLDLVQNKNLLDGTLDINTNDKVSSLNLTVNDPYSKKDIVKESFSSVEELEAYRFNVPSHGSYKVNISYKDESVNEDKTYEKDITFKTDKINFAFVIATMPVSYFTYYSMLDNEAPTYFLLEREKTYNFNQLPENFYPIPYVTDGFTDIYGNTYDPFEFGSYVSVDKGSKIFDSCTPIIKRMYDAMDRNMHVNFYFADYHQTNSYDIGASYLDKEDYDVYLLSDGTNTQAAIYDKVNDINKLNDTISNIKAEYDKGFDAKKLFETAGNDQAYYVAALSSLPNYHHVIPSKEIVISSGPAKDNKDLADYINTNLTEIPFQKIKTDFAKDKEKDIQLRKLLHLLNDDGTSPLDAFNKSDKPNLLILGTSPGGEEVDKVNYFDQILEATVKEFGQTHDIFYKAHPSYPADEKRQELFKKNNIEIYSNSQTPAEFLLLFGDDMYVGGYYTSTFYTIEKDTLLVSFNTREALANFFPTFNVSQPNCKFPIEDILPKN